MFKKCIDNTLHCVWKYDDKYCMETYECFIDKETNRCNLFLKDNRKKTTYSQNTVKTR